jgi:hypothetical protein
MGALSTEYSLWFVGQTTASTWSPVVEAPAMNALRFLPEETTLQSSSFFIIFTIDNYQHNTINPIHPCIHASTPSPQRPSSASSIPRSHYDLHPAHPAPPFSHLPIDLSYRRQGSLEVGSGWNIGKQQGPSPAKVGDRLQPRCRYARGYVYPAASNVI